MRAVLTIPGRVNSHGFIKPIPYASKYRDTASSSKQPVRPDEVLFRRKHAPIRYEETDFYYAHESLPSDLPLPDSDFLTAIHAYSADFYRYATRNRGRTDHRSMNDSALIAVGILLEEAAKESLGETGDLALVEPPEALRRRSSQSSARDSRGRSPGFALGGSDYQHDPIRRKRRRSTARARSVTKSSGDDLSNGGRKKSKMGKEPRDKTVIELD